MGVNSILTHLCSSTSRVACHYLFTLNLIFISFMIFYILKTSSLLGLSPLFQNLVSGVLITSILSLLRLILYFTVSSLPVMPLFSPTPVPRWPPYDLSSAWDWVRGAGLWAKATQMG